jgi:hypothetical protein
MMSKKTKILLSSWSGLILLLVILNILIAMGNQSLQAELAERQQDIAQTIQLETLNRQLITVLANMALKTNDERLKKVLAESGINLDGAPQQPAPKK